MELTRRRALNMNENETKIFKSKNINKEAIQTSNCLLNSEVAFNAYEYGPPSRLRRPASRGCDASRCSFLFVAPRNSSLDAVFSRVSVGFELLLAMKHYARRLFMTGLQNSSAVISISVTSFGDGRRSIAVNNKNIDAVRRMIETDRHVIRHVTRTFLGIESARRPLPHSEEVPVPTFSSIGELSFEENFSNMKSGSDFGGTASIKPKTFIQEEVNDSIRDFDLPKESAEILAFKLREKKLMASGTTVTFYRTIEQGFLPFFHSENDIVFCPDVQNLIFKIGLAEYREND
ncbi:hypothetical protein EVAR_29927_1 [Eumeta japonica]|uniref:Uncharacterized protein n=1 Tax=Eumeta variegata TaxID=151549 RepID=A0A4C1V7K1_EUMVA|nr:hypothetical protein EVAR_29927_1 [Eumeta japonica]